MAWKNVQYENGKLRTSEGGGGGSSTFAGLNDVSFNNLQNGQVPKYNSDTQKWENANESGGGTVTDVTVDGTSVVNQQGVAEIPAIPDGLHHYSTTEHVIGTWIDGKPLYEKTYHFVETSDQTSKSYSISDLNAEVVLLEKSRIKFGANGGYGWQVVPSWYENNQYNMLINVDTAHINITVNGWKFLESVITIQYTKTTD